MTKSEEIQSLKNELAALQNDYIVLMGDFHRKCHELDDARPAAVEKKVRHQKAGTICFDFWPLSDWYRLSLKKWNPGCYAQLCVGPLRVDWFAD